jgi:hypothetical protein
MTAIKHCAGCKHWEAPAPGRHGTCYRITTNAAVPGVVPVTLSAAYLGSIDADVALETAADFGCTLHEGVGT